jgi:hypothetical protein
MFIDPSQNPSGSVRRSGMILNGNALVEFRSFERSWSGVLTWVYKHRTPAGVKLSPHNGKRNNASQPRSR